MSGLLLATATQRRDRLVVPRPAGLRARGAVRQRLLAALLERGLVEERPAKDEGLAWRRDERGRHRALRLTAVGMAAANAPAADADTGAGTSSAARPATRRRSTGAGADHRRFADGLDNWRDGIAKRDRRFRRMAMFAVLEVAGEEGMAPPLARTGPASPR